VPEHILAAMPLQWSDPLGSRLALLAPKCIAGGVKTDYVAVGVHVGN